MLSDTASISQTNLNPTRRNHDENIAERCGKQQLVYTRSIKILQKPNGDDKKWQSLSVFVASLGLLQTSRPKTRSPSKVEVVVGAGVTGGSLLDVFV